MKEVTQLAARQPRPDLSEATFEDLVTEMIVRIGEDPEREGLLRTPERVAKAYEFLTQGYRQEIEKVVNGAIFEDRGDEMVVVADIDLFSMCEHHLLPFIGVCHVGYIPNGKLIGLSKIPRIVEVFARRLQLQERLTNQIAQCLDEVLNPRGVAVLMECQHLCISMRGVQKPKSLTVTSAMLGSFRDNPSTRTEFLELVKNQRSRLP